MRSYVAAVMILFLGGGAAAAVMIVTGAWHPAWMSASVHAQYEAADRFCATLNASIGNSATFDADTADSYEAALAAVRGNRPAEARVRYLRQAIKSASSDSDATRILSSGCLDIRDSLPDPRSEN